ncbi:IQ domain-containing protein IQM2 [Euphorbia lathyris]|uniref:IQ domain-containing protein IQM2 n=1 Tax=Euphorbia lathyris TaxID=212925 RepID=UPI003313B275
MGINFSCPLSSYSDLENALESVTVKSISFGDDEVKTPVRSINFGSQDTEPMILKSVGSGMMVFERSVSFKGGELERRISVRDLSFNKESSNLSLDSANDVLTIEKSPILDPNNPKHEAALRLQKVYKSFRTRRKLADCAVLVEQSWWKLLDFAKLKHSSISYFDIEKHETAISRWSRARTRAAKVGKGLSKNDKARKLALQHWLEAIDPRHRYGHNLHFYYVNWLQSKSREPFFYWLDIGDGKEVNLIEKCHRLKLQQQCIKYLGPMERKAYEVVVEDGKLIYKQTGEFLNTTEDAKWIFVLSTSKTLYVGKKKKGTFQHSSFLAGGVTIAAGRLVVESGILKAVWAHSGHYRPTEENFKDFLSFLRENNVDLDDVKTTPIDEEEDGLRSNRHYRSHSSEEELIPIVNDFEVEEINDEKLTSDNIEDNTRAALEEQKRRLLQKFSMKPNNLEIPRRDEIFKIVEIVNPITEPLVNAADEKQLEEGSNKELSEDEEDNGVENVPAEAILQRINSKKETKSYQLGRQLSFKWTTGAGPRIGCVRDYPSELQFRALEQVNLSPRRMLHSRSTGAFNQKVTVTAAMLDSPVLERRISMHESLPHCKTESYMDEEV